MELGHGKLVRRLHEEDGVGLTMVVGVSLVLALLVAGTLTAAQVTQTQARDDQDYQAALAAAEAGIDDYLYRINRDDNYFVYNRNNLPTPPNPALAFTGSTPQWQVVAGSDNDASFHYDVDASTVGTDGTVVVRSTGRVRDETRTIEATIRRRTILDFLYFTEYETIDPSVRQDTLTFSSNPGAAYSPTRCGSYWCTSGAGTRLWATDNCTRHRYEGRSSLCTGISFAGTSTRRDIIQGPFHTNDAFQVSGSPIWVQTATTSWNDPARRYWIDANPTSNPQFQQGLRYAPPLAVPTSNSYLRAEADPAQGGTGCLYTGPTEIRFLSNGRMQVDSPYSSSPSTRASCLGNGAIPIPANGVIYVDNASASRCDVTQRAGVGGNPLGYPVSGDITPYGCTTGDVFVSGVVQGQITVAAANNIVLIGDLTVNDPAGADVIGLNANNFIEVYHPVRCTSSSCSDYDNISTPDLNDLDLDAALFSLQHSFRVQNHDKGDPRGTLNVTGSIAQLFRGVVGTGAPGLSSGYYKNYVYDPRLRYLSPPHFTDPTTSPWEQRTYAEIRPAY